MSSRTNPTVITYAGNKVNRTLDFFMIIEYCYCLHYESKGIIPLAVFAKESLSVVFTGITNDSVDLSVDILRYVTLPFLKNFGVGDASLTIKKRGAAPLGGGSIEFNCPIVRQLVPIHITDVGLIKRVRGVVFSARISPTIITRVVDSARGVLNNLLPDVYIHADHYKGAEGGKSPGYSLSLVAESTTGVLLSIERTAGEADCGGAGQGGRPESPELLGEEGAYRLLDEIRKGGVVDTSHQSLVLQLMVVCPEDVCKVRVRVASHHISSYHITSALRSHPSSTRS